jgi:hypothetical protein
MSVRNSGNFSLKLTYIFRLLVNLDPLGRYCVTKRRTVAPVSSTCVAALSLAAFRAAIPRWLLLQQHR